MSQFQAGPMEHNVPGSIALMQARKGAGKLKSMVENVKLSTEELVKNMICVDATMNKSCPWLCSTALIIAVIYFVVIYNNPFISTSLPHSKVHFCLDVIFCSIYFTLLLLFFFLRFFATNRAQITTSKFGMVLCLILSVCHLIQALGLDKYVDHSYHFSLVRKGEWIVCIPLSLCLFGHLCKIGENQVLCGSALLFVGLCCEEFGMLGSSVAMNCSFVCLANIIAFPTLYVMYVVCTRLDHLIQASRTLELKIMCVYEVSSYLGYACFNLILCSKVFPSNIMSTALKLFDFFPVVPLVAFIFCFHFGTDGSDNQLKLVALQKANAAQKLFLRFVFHEVRVPFHSLLLGLEYLATQQSFEEHTALLGSLIQSAEVMQRTINDVLLLSKLEDGKLELHQAPFSISEMVKSTLDSLQHMSKENNVQIVARIDQSLPDFVYGDEHRVGQVLANLVSNALKFSLNDSKVEVVIEVLDKNKSSCYFQIQVRDEGIGMTAQEQKLLFLPYSQIRSHETQQDRGSGLGLSIVKHIVELCCGSIKVESEKGKGSTFSIHLTLPISPGQSLGDSKIEGQSSDRLSTVRDFKSSGKLKYIEPKNDRVKTFNSNVSLVDVTDNDFQNRKDWDIQKRNSDWTENVNAARSQKPDETARPNTSKVYAMPSAHKVVFKVQQGSSKEKRIQTTMTPHSSSLLDLPVNVKTALVVDDSQLNRKISRLILESEGFDVDEAVNGQQAIDMATSKIYSIILMDNQMPVLSGVEATRHITACSKIPVIGLTGNSLEEDVKEFMDAGAREVLIKPCKREVMIQAISKYV